MDIYLSLNILSEYFAAANVDVARQANDKSQDESSSLFEPQHTKQRQPRRRAKPVGWALGFPHDGIFMAFYYCLVALFCSRRALDELYFNHCWLKLAQQWLAECVVFPRLFQQMSTQKHQQQIQKHDDGSYTAEPNSIEIIYHSFLIRGRRAGESGGGFYVWWISGKQSWMGNRRKFLLCRGDNCTTEEKNW